MQEHPILGYKGERIMTLTVGIPRTLSYYTFFPLWKVFLEGLGAKVLISDRSNKAILNQGIKDAVNDACVPIKLFHGHVMNLKDRVDCIFIPRMVSIEGETTFCPKFLGLPDMIRFSVHDLPPIIDERFKVHRFFGGTYRFLSRISRKLGYKNHFSITRSYLNARKNQQGYLTLQEAGFSPEELVPFVNNVFEKKLTGNKDEHDINVAVLGYPYAVYDPYISNNLLRNLRKMDVNIATVENITRRELKNAGRHLPQGFFWYYSHRVALSALHLLGGGKVDGIIHITAFGCGPDAMVDKFVELECKRYRVPFLTLTIDEQTGGSGVVTRLEAFIDMLKARKEGFFNDWGAECESFSGN